MQYPSCRYRQKIEAKHITALDDVTLCNEWAKLKRENNRLYAANEKICSGWRGFVLRLTEYTIMRVILLRRAKSQEDEIKK